MTGFASSVGRRRGSLGELRSTARTAAEHVDEGVLEPGRRRSHCHFGAGDRGRYGLGLGVRREDEADRVALDDPVDHPVLVERLGEDRPPTTFHPRELEDPSVDAAGQFGRRPGEQQLAMIEKEHAIAGLGLVEIGRRPHDPDALLGQVLDHLPEFAARNRIDADARLVEEKQTRFLEERAGKAELLLHAARQLAGEPTRESLEIRQGEKLVERGRALGLRQPAQIGVQVEIFLNRQVLVEAEALRHIADSGLNSGGISTSVEAEHLHGPFVRQHEPGHNADQRRLAGAVRPDQPGDFAAPDRSGHRVERGRRSPEALGDLRQPDKLGGRANVDRSGCDQDEFPPCSPRGTWTVTGMPWRNPKSAFSTMIRRRYTRSVRRSGVSTDFGVNSATGDMNPTVPR